MENKSYYNNFIYDWWKNIDKVILFLFITLIILGIFFSLVSTSLIASSKFGTNNYYFFLRHIIYISLGLILIIFFSAIDEKNLYDSYIIFFYFFYFVIIGTNFWFRNKRFKKMVRFSISPTISTNRVFKAIFNNIFITSHRL